MSEAEKDMATEKQTENKVQEAARAEPVKHTKVESGLRKPDSEPVKGKDVTKEDLVKPAHGNDTTDPLTGVKYLATSWTEAVPSAWLDMQVKAGKITKK